MKITIAKALHSKAANLPDGLRFIKAAFLLGYGTLYITDKIEVLTSRTAGIRRDIINDAEALGYDPDLDVELHTEV